MGGCSDAKVTVMVLNVDLDCCQCYRKVKKLLCRFPQIRDQVFDEKQKTVTITVVCCSPEKIKEKLCDKGGKSIKSIAIKEPKKPADPEKAKPKPEDKTKAGAEPEKKEKAKEAGGEGEKAKSKSGDDEQKSKKKNGESKKESSSDAPKQKGDPPPKSADSAPPPAPAAKLLEPEAQWVPGYPPVPPPQVFPVTVYYGGGSSSYYNGVPAGPGPYYPGQGYGYSFGGPPPCQPAYYANRSDYFTDENPNACSIM